MLMEANRGFMLSYNPYLLKNNLEDYHVKIALLNDHLKNELK